VALEVREDGNLQVTERFGVLVSSGDAVVFERSLPAWRYDRVTDVTAAVDGAVVPVGQGLGLGHVRVGAGPGLDVTWTLPAGQDAPHELSVVYTAHNVIELSGIRGLLDWRVLLPRRDFDVEDATVTVALPEGALFLQDPWMEEPAWSVTRQPHGFAGVKDHVPFDRSATAGAEFTIDKMSPTKPQWQSDQEFSDEFVPAFIAAALFILVIGAGILVMVRIRHPPWKVSPEQAGARVEVAPDLTPAMRMAIMHGRSPGDRVLVSDLEAAGLFDRERVRTARDLRVAGWVIMLFGVVVWIAVRLTVTQFGAWPLVVPWSILIVGLMFAVASFRVTLLSETGARLRMLYFARVRDGRTSA